MSDGVGNDIGNGELSSPGSALLALRFLLYAQTPGEVGEMGRRDATARMLRSLLQARAGSEQAEDADAHANADPRQGALI